jgi:hypothetical protein
VNMCPLTTGKALTVNAPSAHGGRPRHPPCVQCSHLDHVDEPAHDDKAGLGVVDGRLRERGILVSRAAASTPPPFTLTPTRALFYLNDHEKIAPPTEATNQHLLPKETSLLSATAIHLSVHPLRQNVMRSVPPFPVDSRP